MEQIYIGTEEPKRLRIRWWSAIARDVSMAFAYRHYIYFSLAAMLKVRYQRSVLGFFWTILNPLASLVILSVVFGNIIGQNIPNYHIYLFCGMVPFSFLQQTVMGCSKSLITSQTAVKQTNMPLIIYPLITACFQLVDFLCSLIGVFIILLFIGVKVHIPIVLIPLNIFILALFSFGLSLVVMTLTTYYRDVEYFVSIFFRGLYFISPVLLTPKMLGRYSFLMTINPVTYFLNLFRSSIYHGYWPSSVTWLITLTMSVAAMVVGYGTYKWFEKRFIFQL